MVVQELFITGTAALTKKVYATGTNHYIKFCDATRLTTYPTTENALMLFVAYLHRDGLSPTTITCYLAGVRSGQALVAPK